MSTIAVGLVLFAALLHASWNALLRSGQDRLWTATVMSLPGLVIAVPFAITQPMPGLEVWPYLLGSAALQVSYTVLLVTAYHKGEFGQVYPIIRGIVPPMVMFGGMALGGDSLTQAQIAGVALVSLGIVSLSMGKTGVLRNSILVPIATGMVIAVYATVDAIGVRVAGRGDIYAAWVLVFFGIFQLVALVIIRKTFIIDYRSPQTWQALTGGVFAMLAYGAVILAYSMAPAGPVVALRETSIVFAMLIGWLAFGERLTVRRILCGITVFAGVVLLSL